MMFLVIRRLCSTALFRLHQHTWLVILAALVSLYAGGFVGMTLLGETEVAENYTWWFCVTITTVGYGDYAPGTPGGRALAILIMFVGIGTIGLVIGKLAEFLIDIGNTKIKGNGCMQHKQHIIIMGYRRGSTEKVVAELRAHRADEHIVLCSSDTESNPLTAHNVDFIRGELSSNDVLNRSNAAHASRVIVHGRDDDSTFFTAYAFREVNTSAHMVCYLSDENHAEKVRKLPADQPSLNQVVLPANVYLMAQEVQDYESSAVIHSLITNLNGHNLYRYDIPENDSVDCTFFDAFVAMKKQFGITLVALKTQSLIVNPSLNEPVKPGMSLFYTGESRLPRIDFSRVDLLSNADYQNA